MYWFIFRFQEPKEHLDDRTETMLKIYEDSTVPKDSQDRFWPKLVGDVVFQFADKICRDKNCSTL